MVPSFKFFEADLKLLAPNKIYSSSGVKSVEVCAHRVSTNAPITLKFCSNFANMCGWPVPKFWKIKSKSELISNLEASFKFTAATAALPPRSFFEP